MFGKNASSVLWNFFNVLGQTFSGIVVGVILARLLSPSDFGIITLAMIFVGFSEYVAAFGVSSSIVQKKDLNEKHIKAANTVAFFMAMFLFLTFFFAAEYISLFFEEDVLQKIIIVMSVGLFFSAIASVPRGYLMRSMKFKLIAKVDLICGVVFRGGVSIALAYSDYGVWSMVIGNVLAMIISSVWLYFSSEISHKFSTSFCDIKDILKYSTSVSIKNSINFASSNSDNLVIGKFFDAATLGLYSRAYQLAALPMQKIAVSISSVMFAVYSDVQDDKNKLKSEYLKTLSSVSILSIPILTGVFIASDYLIIGLYGESWSGASWVLKILCVAAAMDNILHLAGAVVQATDNVYKEVKNQIVYLLILVPGCLIAAQYNIYAVAAAHTVASLWLYISMGSLAISIVGATWSEYLLAQRSGFIMSALTGVFGYCLVGYFDQLQGYSYEYKLFLIIVFFGLFYCVSIAIIPFDDFKKLRGVVYGRLRRKMNIS
ncbi:MAG: lipopolysaccharide biosynthesis protein [Pontibacterium sp.]